MGSDVYLNWKNKTEDDTKKQYTGMSIDAGDAGYMRASIGMHEENQVLREIFPNKFWEPEESYPDDWEKRTEEEKDTWHEENEGPLYDFVENFEDVLPLIAGYLDVDSVPLAENIAYLELIRLTKLGSVLMQSQAKEKSFELIKELMMLRGLGDTGLGEDDGHGKVMWAKSFLDFFLLGLIKQLEGKQPRVYISW